MTDADKLERLHIEAARNITGLTIFARSVKINKHICLEKLEIRRNRGKLEMYPSIIH